MSRRLNRRGISRRQVLGVATATSLAGAFDWSAPLRLQAAELKRRGMACILLWMPGGPSQFETFDPKPDHANGGETKAIDTNVSGIRFADNLPELAKVADKLAVIRSMSTREGDHGRGTHLMHTAYLPIAGVKFPTAGAVAAHEIGDPTCELPAFVRIGGGVNGGVTAGYLGTKYDAFSVTAAGRPPENSRPATDDARFRGRLGLMSQLQTVGKFSDGSKSEHTELYDAASRMILSPQMAAYELDREPQAVRDAYGIVQQGDLRAAMGRGAVGPQATEARRSQFGADCLLARRLIESGVTFVEASVRGWDTHQDNFNQSRTLCGALDLPFAQLLRDLEERGLLERTLIVWAGEFGRTPRINPNSGRDHYPRAFSAVLAGAGIRGGQVVGKTSEGGDAVEDRPVNEKDFYQSIYKALGINAAKQTMTPIGRPIKFVDGGEPVKELFS